MHLAKRLINIVLISIILTFCFLNSQAVEIKIWPSLAPYNIPLYLIIIISVTVGFLLCLFIMTFSGGKKAAKLYKKEKQLQEKEDELLKFETELNKLIKCRKSSDNNSKTNDEKKDTSGTDISVVS